MPDKPKLLEVRDSGDVTIVGFVNQPFLGATQVKAIAKEMVEILQQHRPSVLQFDMSGVALITSDMLGYLLSLRGDGLDVVLYNPSEDVRQVLNTTKLDSLFNVEQNQN